MEEETKVSVKHEAQDEVLIVPMSMITELDKDACHLCSRDAAAVLGLETKATNASRYAGMESEETFCVKPEAIDELFTVSKMKITELGKPACQLCSRAGPDVAAVLGLETKASDINTDSRLPNAHIKKEPEDPSDQKIVTDLLAVRKFCDRTKEENEEEREMIAGLIAAADEVSADQLLSATPIKKEPEDTKDQQVIEDLLGFCRLCDIEDKELALALQPVHSNVEESTRPISGNSRSMRNAIRRGSGVRGEAVTRRAGKCTPPETTRCTTGSDPSRALDDGRTGSSDDSADGSYTCSSCAETFTSKYRLVKHVFVHTSGVRAPQHVCRLCGEVFTSGRNLQRHLRAEECVSVGGAGGGGEGRECGSAPGDRPTPGAGCGDGKVFSGISRPPPSARCNLQTENSKRKCHSADSGESHPSAFESHVPQNLSTLKRPHTCYTCHKSFSSSSDLKRHTSVHSLKKPFKCVDCDKRFRRADHLRKHRVTHSEILPFKCGECGKSFKRYDTLRKHGLVHTDTRSYSCADCGKTFKSRSYLVVHTRSHIGHKPHECDICGARFTRGHTLADHKKLHSGEKPFECGVCGAVFSRAFTRREHMTTHMGEKPHRCTICGATFGFASVYRKHKRLSSAEMQPKCGDCSKPLEIDNVLEQLGVVQAEKSSHRCISCGKTFIRDFRLKRPFECGYCGQLFCLISAIRKHALVHTIKRSYECVNCGNIYKRRDNLNRHRKSGSCKPDDRGKSFSRIHISKKKSYECVDCGNYFIRADSLKRHQRMGWCKSSDSNKSFSRVDVLKSRRKISSAKI